MTSNTKSRNVWITSSDSLAQICDILPANEGRQTLVTSLIKAFELDQAANGIINIIKLKRRDLERFHGREYLDVLLRKRLNVNEGLSNFDEITDLLKSTKFKDEPEKEKRKKLVNSNDATDELGPDDDSSDLSDSDTASIESISSNPQSISDGDDLAKLDKYGLSYDCPIFPFMADYSILVSSSSISTASKLIELHELYGTSKQNIVINWYGGRHHCFKHKAMGFCYVNDIVLAINTLRKTFKKVFYLDFDLHHGDGVETAFEFSKNVMTCSVHRYDIGFYPGTGDLKSSSKYKINIPTKKGLNDNSMRYIIENIVVPLIMDFGADTLVIQAGCDGLSTDEHKEWNMSIKGYGSILSYILGKVNIPTMILGGGGYNHTEVAKCWTYMTKIALDQKDEWDIIPEHEYLDSYEGEGFRFWTQDNQDIKHRKDENDEKFLLELKNYILRI